MISTRMDAYDDLEYQEFLRDLDDARERELHAVARLDRLDDFAPAASLWYGRPISSAAPEPSGKGVRTVADESISPAGAGTAGTDSPADNSKACGDPARACSTPDPCLEEEVRGAGDSSSCGDASAVGPGSNRPGSLPSPDPRRDSISRSSRAMPAGGEEPDERTVA